MVLSANPLTMRVWSWSAVAVLLLIHARAFPLSTSIGRVQGRRTCRRSNSIPFLAASPAETTRDEDTADDLTKEELALRFAEVRDYYRETNEMAQEDVCLNMLRTRLPKLRLNRCHVDQSTIPQAGQGLFASRNLAEGELITLYPGDALLIWSKEVGDFNCEVGVMFGNHVEAKDRDPSRVSTDEARSYELKIRTSHSIVADPLLVDDAAYLGHMCNDGSALMNRNNASRTEYSQETFDRHNAAFFVMEGCHFTGIATKDIAKDEEIFVSYGEGYWLSRSYKKEAADEQ